MGHGMGPFERAGAAGKDAAVLGNAEATHDDARAGQAAPSPVLELPVEQDDASEVSVAQATPTRGARSKNVRISRRAFDRLLDHWQDTYLTLGHYGAAREAGTAQWKDDVELRDGLIDLKPPNEFARHIAERRGRAYPGDPSGAARRSANGRGFEAAGETPEVGAARRAWDEAARAGDPDAMTRAANALIRAVAAAKPRSGSHEATHADDGRDPTSQILAPHPERRDHPAFALDEDVGARSDADVAAGHVAVADEPGEEHPGVTAGAVTSGASDRELPSGWANQDGHAVLSPEQALASAKLITQAPEEQQQEILRQLHYRFGNAGTASIDRQLPPAESASTADRSPSEVRGGAGPDFLDTDAHIGTTSRVATAEVAARARYLLGSIRGTEESANNGLLDPPVKRRCTHQFCVQRDWRLQQKATNWGWIIQRVTVETTWFDERGIPRHDVAHFYEAWYVPRGSDRPTETSVLGEAPYPNDFVGFDGKPGTKGDVKFTVSARFYEGLALDGSRFKRHNADAYAGRLLATVPTETPQDMEFRNPDGSVVPSTGAIDRTWTHSWGWQ
jgi:hypothetical protein